LTLELTKSHIDTSVDDVMSRITFTTKCDLTLDQKLLIIEAIPEVLQLKQSLFKRLKLEFAIQIFFLKFDFQFQQSNRHHGVSLSNIDHMFSYIVA